MPLSSNNWFFFLNKYCLRLYKVCYVIVIPAVSWCRYLLSSSSNVQRVSWIIPLILLQQKFSRSPCHWLLFHLLNFFHHHLIHWVKLAPLSLLGMKTWNAQPLTSKSSCSGSDCLTLPYLLLFLTTEWCSVSVWGPLLVVRRSKLCPVNLVIWK